MTWKSKKGKTEIGKMIKYSSTDGKRIFIDDLREDEPGRKFLVSAYRTPDIAEDAFKQREFKTSKEAVKFAKKLMKRKRW